MKLLGFPRQEYVTKKAKINEILCQLSEKFQNAKKDLEDIGKRLAEVEAHFTQPPTPGIFTYIEEGSDQALFIEKIEEAIILEMTYAQIDEHLTESLSAELCKIIKDHPSLTKDYIRSVRKD